ncbi:nonsense-mediated mRNA decay protein 2-like [Helianthus annuus]|uniref:nonsense-mediated mRNA decay protein 2-like n=1 Tax=Helianthus annuus TaxID=4232 RepID=UPI000B90782F|nr:nonsense-mediated mRNA decay protein 2-like [Helianthus annuus]
MEIERRELPSSDEFQRWPPMVSSSDVVVAGRWRNPLGGGCETEETEEVAGDIEDEDDDGDEDDAGCETEETEEVAGDIEDEDDDGDEDDAETEETEEVAGDIEDEDDDGDEDDAGMKDKHMSLWDLPSLLTSSFSPTPTHPHLLFISASSTPTATNPPSSTIITSRNQLI